jgi:ABC-type branched-subunit amino acid transport system substrate-binding protein
LRYNKRSARTQFRWCFARAIVFFLYAIRSIAKGFAVTLKRWCAGVASLLVMAKLSAAQDIVLGQSAALSGPAQELGKAMQLGEKTYFDGVNAADGIRGKKIVLRTLDDGYEPPRAEANTKKLVDDGDVLALFGYVGTPTSAASIPVATLAKALAKVLAKALAKALAKVLVEALRRGGDASREALIKSLESLRNVDIGGFNVSFGPDNRSASSFVELTVLNKKGEIRY